MTAHAMKGDRETCLESGMNDYISKPIKRETVFEILDKWIFHEGTGGTLPGTTVTDRTETENPSCDEPPPRPSSPD